MKNLIFVLNSQVLFGNEVKFICPNCGHKFFHWKRYNANGDDIFACNECGWEIKR